MMKCPNCGQAIDAEDKFCGNCQTPLKQDERALTDTLPAENTPRVQLAKTTDPSARTQLDSPPPPPWRRILLSVVAVVLIIGSIVGGFVYYKNQTTTQNANAHGQTQTANNSTATVQAQFSATATTKAQANATATAEAIFGTWDLTKQGNLLHIAYGSGTSVPEYAALDLNSSYLRLNYGPPSSWGTSLILLPAFWSQTACQASSRGYCQGAPVTATWQVSQSNLHLVLTITGVIGGLTVSSQVDLSPPTKAPALTAQVTTTAAGNVALDTNRPGEAFKPIMLASMHVSATQWDTQQASTDTQVWPFPQEGRIVQPPVNARSFSLKGGTSDWKANAPTITVVLDQQDWQVTGWVTKTSHPTDDNVGFWAASTNVLPSWSFTITASP